MTARARYAGLACALLLVLAGLVLRPFGSGLALVIIGALLVLGLVFEQRYRGARPDLRPGPGWQRTGERFRDEESGQWMEVWFDPRTGERRYVIADQA